MKPTMLAQAILTTLPLLAGAAHADVFSDIKYTDLVARLGAATPTGANVGIGQVEAPENAAGSYAPDTTLPEFSGKTISLLSGTGLAASGHATEVGRNLYGNTVSVAKGVSFIASWNVNAWVGAAYLRVGGGSAQPPLTPPTSVRVFNHSWIGSFGSAANDNDALRRVDYTVTRDNIFVAAGTNNGAGSAAQPMMAYAFNGVTVGLPDGNHATALTPAGIDGPNRRKPDLVAPGGFTSFATPVVGACAALLYQTATIDPALVGNANAYKALTIKAALMAGTTHRAGWNNGAPTSGASRGITATPLDPTYGADLVNIDRAHRIFTAGETNGSTVVQPTVFFKHQGWDLVQSVASGASAFYSFRVTEPIDEASFIASWHRNIALTFTSWTVQDFDLRLLKLVNGVPTPISGDAGAAVFSSGNCESVSTADNTEHVYVRNLQPGDYVVELKRNAGTQVAMPVVLAWYMPNTAKVGDIDGDFIVGASDIAILLNQWGGPGSGDLNGDGLVNASDIAALLSNWG